MSESLSSRIEEANTTLIGNRNLNSISDFFASNYVVHITGKDKVGGHSVVREVLETLLHAFPDLAVNVEIFLEGNGRVAWQRTLRGTHSGKFKGFPANGRELMWRDMVISQFESGLIAKEWVVTDLAERLLLARKK